MMKRVNVLVDNESWILPYAEILVRDLKERKIDALLCRSAASLSEGWITFLLGCTKLISEKDLKKSQHNLVVHESALPKGKGFAPVAWQILEGAHEIPVSLIEALPNKADAGNIWLQDSIYLKGTELCSEWRRLQGECSICLCLKAVDDYQNIKPVKQQGEETFYPRRTPIDSELNVHDSLSSQFNLLRVVDNQHYPAFFYHDGKKYVLKIEQADIEDD
ncbi:methionyl-tRNA formyltransferase [Pseudidiomarina salinarum]|nr:methionyl-tRNA formyltransferase [Pseudidiomarina salinarum]